MRTIDLRKPALLLAAAVLVTGMGLAAGAKPAPEPAGDRPDQGKFRFLAHDNFDGKFGLNWKPVRYDASHVSFTKRPGQLTVTTQRGTIHADEKARGEPSAKNIFLIDNPLAKDADFVITTCISDFTPTESYQQAGLICYNDDDNYIKFAYEYNWPKGGGQAFALVRETEAKPEHDHVDAEDGLKKVWLRLTRRGTSWEFATSSDGKDFTSHGERDWGDGAPRKLGFLAKNGGPENAPPQCTSSTNLSCLTAADYNQCFSFVGAGYVVPTAA
jgi:regulation of enolase protein 1 (concanavalin A-like superfamily)